MQQNYSAIYEAANFDFNAFEKNIKAVRMEFLTGALTNAFSPLLLQAETKYDPTFPAPAAISTNELIINPIMATSICNNKNDWKDLLLHEVMHNLMSHNTLIQKIESKWRKLMSIAMDIVINLILVKEGSDLVKREGVIPNFNKIFPTLNYDAYYFEGKDTMFVYETLKKEVESNEEYKSEEFAEDALGKGEDDLRPDELIESETNGIKMGLSGNPMGSSDNELGRMIQKLHKPKVNWRAALMQYATKYIKDDWTYRRINIHYAPDLILPTLDGNTVEDMAAFIDTSGSIVCDQDLLNKILQTTSNMRNLVRPEKIHVGCFDTQVKNIQEFSLYHDMRTYQPVGGGGTCLHETMSWIKDKKPLVTVIFTDGEFNTNLENPRSDVIWVIFRNKDFKAPFGRVIYYEGD